jgi:quercetin dioxygenase-like cupin family protein
MVALVKSMKIKPQKMLEGVTMRMVIGPDNGARHFNMRIFEVEPGSSTPHHSHWWEHEVYVLSGKGIVRDHTGDKPIRPGDAVLVSGDENHQFVNTGSDTLRFMCLVPQEWLETVESQGYGDNPGCTG